MRVRVDQAGDEQPIASVDLPCPLGRPEAGRADLADRVALDRKSTRLNSSHSQISYAVFCLKKKKKINRNQIYKDERGSQKISNDCRSMYREGLDGHVC